MILSNDVILDQINKAATLSIEAYKNGGKTIWAGNGGSAADAQHLAGEMVSKFYFDRPGLPAIALNTDTSIVTAIGNDYGFDKLFSRQVQANGKRGDIFFGISTSGNSKNIVEALKLCREMGIVTVGFNGAKIGTMDELCDICIKVPSPETPRIQEAHTLIGHIICYLVEDAIFGELKPQE
ncbi:MAG: D-sedoheptulose 7-phosphate isomerase [bacterium]